MKISVITTVRNAVDTVEETIQSVANQDYPDVEHVIVDGASDDGTQQVISRYRKNLGSYVSEPDQGIYHGMNKGIDRAVGDVIGFLNADDSYQDESVLSQVAEVFTDPEVDGCYANLVYVDARDTDRIIRYWNSREYQPGLFERGWMPAHPTFYVRARFYRELGGFDTRYRYQSDFEHTARFMAVNNIRTRYIPSIWVRMRMGGTTNRSIGNVIRGNLESYSACKTLGLRVTPFYFVTKFMNRLPQFFSRPPETKGTN